MKVFSLFVDKVKVVGRGVGEGRGGEERELTEEVQETSVQLLLNGVVAVFVSWQELIE